MVGMEMFLKMCNESEKNKCEKVWNEKRIFFEIAVPGEIIKKKNCPSGKTIFEKMIVVIFAKNGNPKDS